VPACPHQAALTSLQVKTVPPQAEDRLALGYDLPISLQARRPMAITLPAAAQLITLGNDLTLLQLDSGSFSPPCPCWAGNCSPSALRPASLAIHVAASRTAAWQGYPWWRAGMLALVWRAPDDTTAPSHGVARQQSWQLLAVEQDGDAFHVKLQGPQWQGLSVQLDYTLADIHRHAAAYP
jgi:glucose-6-phosphate 1-epimerase